MISSVNLDLIFKLSSGKIRTAPKAQRACSAIDDYAKDGGEELFTKMHCVL